MIPLVVLLLALLAPAVEAEELAGAEEAASRLGLALDSGAEMSIRSDELELMRSDDGQERVVFRNAVTAVQGSLEITCDWLEAVYPADSSRSEGGSGGPDRITARGGVQIRQQGVELWCAEATFDRRTQRALCRGGTQGARLRRAGGVVTGKEIHFDGRTGIFKVRGDASVTIAPRPRGMGAVAGSEKP